jgi:hypothetical protein
LGPKLVGSILAAVLENRAASKINKVSNVSQYIDNLPKSLYKADLRRLYLSSEITYGC